MNPEESRHHRIERRYWLATALLTFIAVCGTIATVMLSISSLNESKRTTAEVARQANIASQTLIASNRPWIAISGLTADYLDITKDEVRLTVEVEFQNVGHAPAQQIDVVAKIVSFGEFSDIEAQRKFCTSEDNKRHGKFIEGVVFPDTGIQRRRLV